MTYQAIGLERMIEAAQTAPPSAPMIPLRWLALATACCGAVVVGLLVRNRLTVDWLDPAMLALMGVIVGLAALRYAMRDASTLARRRARDIGAYWLLMFCMATVGGFASYAAACNTSGFVDAALAHGDRLLHFDWVACYQFVARHPLLQQLGAGVYSSVFVSPLAMLGVMAWRGEQAQAHRFLITFFLGAAITLVLFPLFPGRGALEYLWHGPIPYMPTNGVYQGQLLPELRNHTFHLIQVSHMRGLVCAPSFHTVCATIYLATAWRVAWLRWVLVPLNAAMMLSIPVEGTHYLTDMLLGLIVALVAISLARACTELFARRATPAY